MEYKLIKIIGDQIDYTDDQGTHHKAAVDDLIWENTISYFNAADTEQIFKCSRSNSGELTLDQSGRLLWMPRALLPMQMVLTICFVACMTMSVMCSLKTIPAHWLGDSAVLFGSIVFFPLAFAVTDIINELFGYRATRQIIVLTSIALICTGFVFKLTLSMPGLFRGQDETAYLSIFSFFPNAFVIHGIALFFGALVNARLFSYLRGLLVNRYLWLRSFVSTFVSQFFYGIVCLAMMYVYGYHSDKTLEQLLDLVFSNQLVKMGIAVAGLPLIYAVVKWAYLWGRKKSVADKLEQLKVQQSQT